MAEGDLTNASISAVAIVPIVGQAATAGKFAGKSGLVDDVVGGVYELVDSSGISNYVGRTKYFGRRQGEQLRNYPDLEFEVRFSSDDYATVRGLEQNLYESRIAGGANLRNKINPVGPRNPNRGAYNGDADVYMDLFFGQ